MYLDHDDRYQLMKEEEADARDAALARVSPLGRALGGPIPTVIDALGMHAYWHADYPFDGSHGERKLDLALADAFRMMIYLREPRAQLRWIEREISDMRASSRTCNAFEAEIIRWWLAIYDNEQRSRRYG